MWLAPLADGNSVPNCIEFVCDGPTVVACLRVWNYSRTPGRGVRDVEMYFDDLLVYQGLFRQATKHGRCKSHHLTSNRDEHPLQADDGEAILFTDSPMLIDRERARIYLPTDEERVTFFDERQPVYKAAHSQQDCVPERPNTAVVVECR